jgi:hypothetical protein
MPTHPQSTKEASHPAPVAAPVAADDGDAATSPSSNNGKSGAPGPKSYREMFDARSAHTKCESRGSVC